MYCVHCGNKIIDETKPCPYCKEMQPEPKIQIKVIKILDDEQLFERTIEEYIQKGYEIKASNITIRNNISNNGIAVTAYRYCYYALMQKIRK